MGLRTEKIEVIMDDNDKVVGKVLANGSCVKLVEYVSGDKFIEDLDGETILTVDNAKNILTPAQIKAVMRYVNGFVLSNKADAAKTLEAQAQIANTPQDTQVIEEPQSETILVV